jgi:hypothetical protein
MLIAHSSALRSSSVSLSLHMLCQPSCRAFKADGNGLIFLSEIALTTS